MASVKLDHIAKRFGSTVALGEVNLTIGSGEIFFLLGPSGCGKSTLLRIIAGLHEPSSGRVFFDDRDVTSLPTEKRNAVMCFQSYALWPHMSVRENVRFGLTVRNISTDEQERRISEVLRLVQMENLADRKPNQLSGGQQQRVAIARALVNNPEIILADEPTGNLDSATSNEIMEMLTSLNKEGRTIIMVTHEPDIANWARRQIVMRDGVVFKEALTADILRAAAAAPAGEPVAAH
jgi:iron(III) transport system ATP-binding protein